MDPQASRLYEFSGFQFDVAQKALTRNGEMILLPRKALHLLLYLVQNRGRILEKSELMEAVWPDCFVEESNLSHQIFVLRKALGDDQNGNSFIQTIPRRGYKFVAAVRELDSLPEKARMVHVNPRWTSTVMTGIKTVRFPAFRHLNRRTYGRWWGVRRKPKTCWFASTDLPY